MGKAAHALLQHRKSGEQSASLIPLPVPTPLVCKCPQKYHCIVMP